jgi:hypothetical protein
MLSDWRSSQNDLQNLMGNSPALAEAKQLALDFQNLTKIALETLDALESKRVKGSVRKSDEWRDAQLKTLSEIAKPKAALEFAIVESVKKMVSATSEQ